MALGAQAAPARLAPARQPAQVNGRLCRAPKRMFKRKLCYETAKKYHVKKKAEDAKK